MKCCTVLSFRVALSTFWGYNYNYKYELQCISDAEKSLKISTLVLATINFYIENWPVAPAKALLKTFLSVDCVIATRVLVTVVPMFAPMIMGMPCWTVTTETQTQDMSNNSNIEYEINNVQTVRQIQSVIVSVCFSYTIMWRPLDLQGVVCARGAGVLGCLGDRLIRLLRPSSGFRSLGTGALSISLAARVLLKWMYARC